MVNHMILQGRLVRDPEAREAGSTNVTSFCVAWSEKYGDRENKIFLNVNAWGKTGDFVKSYFQKGQEIVVEGRITQRDYTDRNGNKRTAVEMTADHVHFCGPKQDSYAAPDSHPTPAGNGVNVSASDFEEMSGDDEDLPF